MSFAYEPLRPELLKPEAIPSNGEGVSSISVALDTDLDEQVIPVPRVIDPGLVALADVQQAAAERFRVLSTRLYHLRMRRPLRKLLLTSPVPGDGKTLVAANLAVSLSAGKQRVLLLGGDLRHAGLNGLFELNGLPGLSDAVNSDRDVGKSLYRLESHSLWLMPSGATAEHPLELLQSPRLEELMKSLSASFDWVVIDSPPVLPFADVDAWARLCDGALLVVRQSSTPKQDLQAAIEGLTGCPLLGVVFNDCKERRTAAYYEHRGSALDGLQ